MNANPARNGRTPAMPALLAILFIVAGCGTVPPTIVQQPTTMQPVAAVAPAAPNGAIFQAQAYRPLFEDRRARFRGDTLSIVINERTSAGKQVASSASKAGSINFGIPKLFGVPTSTIAALGVATNSAGKFEDKGAETASNNFTSTIGVTVIDVMPNGNLLVSGEKQIALDKGTEFVRFSGVVRPDTITAGNLVSSTQVADARVEYRTNTRVDTAQVVSSLSRFFFSVLPF